MCTSCAHRRSYSEWGVFLVRLQSHARRIICSGPGSMILSRRRIAFRAGHEIYIVQMAR